VEQGNDTILGTGLLEISRVLAPFELLDSTGSRAA